MNEKYLHLLWKQQRFLTSELTLTDGKPIVVKHPGTYNELLSGPDFEMGRVLLDGIEWCGPIELHVNASDWYKHNHQTDEAYQNVILHVVYENDDPVVVNGYKLPTLELKNHISLEHYWKFSGLNPAGNKMICSRLLGNLSPELIKKTILNALHDKLNRKSASLAKLDKEEQFYRLLGAAFGMSVNKEPFEELTASISWAQLKDLSPSQRFHLLFVASGLLSDRRKNVTSGGFKWNFKGTRPANFPSKRMSQFAEFISRLPIDRLIQTKNVLKMDEMFNHYVQSSDQHVKGSLFSKQFSDHLKINTIAPFAWMSNRVKKREVIDYLCSFDAEENAIIKKWKSFGILVESSADSQGLIALYRYRCCEKKCLSCDIGKVLLNKSE